MALESYIQELADPAHEPTAAGLQRLSGLPREEREELQEQWLEISPERRLSIVQKLADLAEESVEVDFLDVFRVGCTDETPAVRERAVSALWECNDRRDIRLLVSLLSADEALEVRAAAATVLGGFAQQGATSSLIERDDRQVFDALITALEDEEEHPLVRRRALEAVAVYGGPEIDVWIRWAQASEDPAVQQSAVFAMGRTCQRSWLPAILAEMDSPDPAMRFEAANAARELGERDVIPRLAELADDSDSEVAMAALQAMGAIGGSSAKRLLRVYAEEAQTDAVQQAAKEALDTLEVEESDLSMIEHGSNWMPGE